MFQLPSLSISLSGLEPGDSGAGERPGGVRRLIAWAKGAGFGAVQLDCAVREVRARELDRSARRDLAALLRRSELTLSGLDLWIPEQHFADASRVDRAVEAVVGAIGLAADLRSLSAGPAGAVSVHLGTDVPDDAAGAMRRCADDRGVRIADHTWPARAGAVRGAGSDPGPLGVGIDPSLLLMSGADPAAEVSRLGEALVSARLTDAGPHGRVRPGSGEGRLDLLRYGVALATAGYGGHVVLDMRGAPRPLAEAGAAARAWSEAAAV